jgi:hypothetical protein
MNRKRISVEVKKIERIPGAFHKWVNAAADRYEAEGWTLFWANARQSFWGMFWKYDVRPAPYGAER